MICVRCRDETYKPKKKREFIISKLFRSSKLDTQRYLACLYIGSPDLQFFNRLCDMLFSSSWLYREVISVFSFTVMKIQCDLSPYSVWPLTFFDVHTILCKLKTTQFGNANHATVKGIHSQEPEPLLGLLVMRQGTTLGWSSPCRTHSHAQKNTLSVTPYGANLESNAPRGTRETNAPRGNSHQDRERMQTPHRNIPLPIWGLYPGPSHCKSTAFTTAPPFLPGITQIEFSSVLILALSAWNES